MIMVERFSALTASQLAMRSTVFDSSQATKYFDLHTANFPSHSPRVSACCPPSQSIAYHSEKLLSHCFPLTASLPNHLPHSSPLHTKTTNEHRNTQPKRIAPRVRRKHQRLRPNHPIDKCPGVKRSGSLECSAPAALVDRALRFFANKRVDTTNVGGFAWPESRL